MQPGKKCMSLQNESGKVHPALASYFGYCLYKAAIRHRHRLNEALESHGLIAPQVGIMAILSASGPSSQVALGDALGIDKATMVKLIDGMERLKLVGRLTGAEDRRVKQVSLTAKGETQLAKCLKLSKEVKSRFLSPLSARERETLENALPLLLRD